ncbi:MAG: hypothetical protein FWD59_01330 [Micrococcales bacterium]|nr:hypothetical protein [Micrococcales bacterium]
MSSQGRPTPGEVETFAYAPVSRAGFLWGFAFRQLALAAGAAVFTAGAFVRSPGTAVKVLPLSVVVGVFALGSWRRRTLMSRAEVFGHFLVRRVLGQTRWMRTTAGGGDGLVEGAIRLPGAMGRRAVALQLVGIGGGQCSMIYDAGSGEATVVLRCRTKDWATADDAIRSDRMGGFVDLCTAISELEGVVRVVFQARTRGGHTARVQEFFEANQPATEAGEATVVLRGDAHQAGADVADDYRDALADPLWGRAAAERDVLITLTVARRLVAREMSDAGGGLRGLSWVMGERLAQVSGLLDRAGVAAASTTVLTAGALRGELRQAFDPQAAEWLEAVGQDLDPGDPLAQAIEEDMRYVGTDTSVHQVLWVERWPAVPTPGGFLDGLISVARCHHTVTIIIEPMDEATSAKRYANRVTAHASVVNRDARLERPLDPAHVAEGVELAARQSELAQGFGDVRFSGFVVVTGRDTLEVRKGVAEIRRAAAGLRLTPAAGQQWASFLVAGLPLGLGVARQ